MKLSELYAGQDAGQDAGKWWPMDQLHRQFSALSERYLSTHCDLHIKTFIEIRKSLYSLKFLVNTLGGDSIGSRKGRRFANKISEWLKDLPFDVAVEQTTEGKEYRKI